MNFKAGDKVTVKTGKYIGHSGVVIRIIPVYDKDVNRNHVVVKLNNDGTSNYKQLTYKEDSLEPIKETVSSTTKIKFGDKVTVKVGKYAGYTGTILRYKEYEKYCLVNLDKIHAPNFKYRIEDLELTSTNENEPMSNKDNLKDLIVKEYADKQIWCIIDNSGGLEASALTLDQVKKLIVDEYDESYHIEIMIPMFDLKAETTYSFTHKD